MCNVLVIIGSDFLLLVLPYQTYSESTLPFFRTNGIELGNYGEYEYYDIICGVAKYLSYSLAC